MKRLILAIGVGITAIFAVSCHSSSDTPPPPENKNITPPAAVPQLHYTVNKVYPHDTSSYTEGLEWHDGALYESTGNYGESQLRINDLTTGKSVKLIHLADRYFGEGISVFKDKLYQLTYREKKVFVYDAKTFKPIHEFQWNDGEGWGMTHDDSNLIISNGSSFIYFVNPDNFSIKRKIQVADNGVVTDQINELEYVDGSIYANVWQTNTILKINPATGEVTGKLDLTGLLGTSGMKFDPSNFTGENATSNVLNGIAYNPDKKCFYITGKHWPALFEMKIN